MKKLLIRLTAILLLMVLLPAVPLLKDRPPEGISSAASGESEENGFPESQSGKEPSEQLTLPPYYRVLETDSDRILKVTPQEYLMGAAAAELPSSAPLQALIAQMVASHSYALTVMAADPDSPWISDDPAVHQGYLTPEKRRTLYGDALKEQEALLTEAASQAVGWLLTTDGEQLLPAAFHGCSAGKTESAEHVWGSAVPCLTAVDSPWDQSAPDFQRETVFSKEELRQILQQHCPDGDDTLPWEDWLRVDACSPSGTVLRATAWGISCTGQEIRSWLSLPSACFTLQWEEGALHITTRGKGHGVGMSQYGAMQMALSGSSWQDILAHYYPGSQLISAAPAS